MSIEEKLAALTHVYRVLAETQKAETLFCHRGCSTCCTLNVTITTLEGYHLIHHLTQTKQMDQLAHISPSAIPSVNTPTTTINTLAKRYSKNGEAVEAPPIKYEGVCPLLRDDMCTVYPARPLACRMMLSRRDFCDTGYADMNPFDLTVNNVMMQFTEHIDQEGLTGNLIDVLGYLADENKRSFYETATGLKETIGLLSNRPLNVLMVPPEHRQSITPVLKALNPAMGDVF